MLFRGLLLLFLHFEYFGEKSISVMQRTATKDLAVIIRKAVIVCAVNVLCSRHCF